MVSRSVITAIAIAVAAAGWILSGQVDLFAGDDTQPAPVQVAVAAANLDAAKAILKRYRINLRHLTIQAPFAGVVERRDAELGDFVQAGDPVALIVDDDPILVVGQVSERNVGKLEIGGRGRARVRRSPRRTTAPAPMG